MIMLYFAALQLAHILGSCVVSCHGGICIECQLANRLCASFLLEQRKWKSGQT